MKAFTVVTNLLIFVGGIGLLILCPMLFEDIANDAIYYKMLTAAKILSALLITGMFGNAVYCIIRAYKKRKGNM